MPKIEELAALTSKAVGEMAKDPICGMVVPKDRSIKREVGGRAYYFCSETCVRTFEAPEAELKDGSSASIHCNYTCCSRHNPEFLGICDSRRSMCNSCRRSIVHLQGGMEKKVTEAGGRV